MLSPVLPQTAVQPTIRVPRCQLGDGGRDCDWALIKNDCKEKGEWEKKIQKEEQDSCWKLSFCPKTCFCLWQSHHHWTEISSPFRIHRRGLAICAFVTRPGENVHASVWGGRLGNSCHIFPFSFKTKMKHTPKCAHTHSHTCSLSICFHRLLITVNISTENTIK